MLRIPMKLFLLFVLATAVAECKLLSDMYAMAHMVRHDLAKEVKLRQLRQCMSRTKKRFEGRLDTDDYWAAQCRCKERFRPHLRPLYEII